VTKSTNRSGRSRMPRSQRALGPPPDVVIPFRLDDETASFKWLGMLLAMFPSRLATVARPSGVACRNRRSGPTALIYLPHNHRGPIPPSAFGGLKVFDPKTGKHLSLPPELGGGIRIYDSETDFALPMPESDTLAANPTEDGQVRES